MKHRNRPYQPIENYGVIGNLKTVALVSLKGSIDFMSFPDFDSPTVFASMLDRGKGGYFSIEPQIEDYNSRQMYIPGTAVLLTRFFSEEGIAEISDYMPLNMKDDGDSICSIVRKVTSVRGDLSFKMFCSPRFDYARALHKAKKADKDRIIFTPVDDGDFRLHLIADVPLRIREHDGYAEFTLKESEVAYIALESVRGDEEEKLSDISSYSQSTYDETILAWRRWANKSNYKGRWTELVQRSAITLKLLTSIKHGSVIAAATFGLPETLGGDRNWDYRFTWIRDAAFSMYAFLRLGYYEEATAFLDWIHKQCYDKKLHLIYGVDGHTDLTEYELDHLDGYEDSKPVRIGNDAQRQLQIDIYGELIDTIYIYNKSYKPITYDFWTIIERQIGEVVKNWKKPDHGIWEIRNSKKQFLHTRLMCWVAMDRAIKIAEHRSFPHPAQEWAKVRDDIYRDIFDNFWNEKVQAWVQYKGSDCVDASVLLMPLTHFISPLEPRWLKTMETIDRTLRLDVLIYRYQNHEEKIDGLDGEEGTFNMCSFWFIEALAKSGYIERAVENFEKMLGYANHLGLFSEELGKRGQHLGNFPQAFTHLSLISTALELDKQIGRRSR
ncbi:MAG: glycoside hydrolase family 15 protein [Mucilaginibacter polytrichastri]|nr:glycoside hydrolase family 15 protein [Mucilaginibacter polytrichastri]